MSEPAPGGTITVHSFTQAKKHHRRHAAVLTLLDPRTRSTLRLDAWEAATPSIQGRRTARRAFFDANRGLYARR